MSKKVFLFILTLIVGSLFFGLKYFNVFSNSPYKNIEVLAVHSNGSKFVGSAQCVECHQEIYKYHIENAHFKSSQLPSNKSISGFLNNADSILKIDNPHTYEMTQEKDKFYQLLKLDSINKILAKDKLDIVIGSGVRGQSYLSWNVDSLFQLQASYAVKPNKWINSPGFKKELRPKNRKITATCLECHVTFAENIVDPKPKIKNRFNKKNILLGIDCERCHGPALNHVAYHKKYPLDSIGKHIVKHSELTRKQKLDLCALCHSGLRKIRFQPPFKYVVSQNLDSHSLEEIDFSYEIDVHGNQYRMLKNSKCFKMSETMDCNTCHDPHKNERGNIEKFNKACLGCHKSIDDCGMSEELVKTGNNDCVNCHMPKLASQSIKIVENNTLESVRVRSHFIKVYKDSEKQLANYIKEFNEK